MSDLVASPIPLNSGLDLSTAKMLAPPGSMVDCLNYELIDQLGYHRILGFAKYNGRISLKDIPDVRVYSSVVSISGALPPADTSDYFLWDYLQPSSNSTWVVSYTPITPTTGRLVYIPLTGSPILTDQQGGILIGPTTYNTIGEVTEGALTQQQLIDFEAALTRGVIPLPASPVGLHWHRDFLYAVVPEFTVQYRASDVNQETSFTPYTTLTAGSATGTLIDRRITIEAGASVREEGYLIIRPNTVSNWVVLANTTTLLTGAITVGAGTVNMYGDAVLYGPTSDYCSLWVATRPPNMTDGPYTGDPGWSRLGESFTATVNLSGVTTAFNSLALGNTEAESTYYFESSSGNSVSAILVDYWIVSGTFEDGDAIVRLQYQKPVLNAGTHALGLTTADDMYLETGTTTKLGDISVNGRLNALPGIPSLKENQSRYEFISANFYASDEMDAFYGVNGAGRAFTFGRSGDYFSFIYTQNSAALDKPRHVENHALHLALGFKQGSVQLSVVGDPTNFSGLLGATEIGVGDRVTGLMSLTGTTLGVFCDSSVWSIAGNTVDNFNTQVILPKLGCVEYTLVNCGEPVFCSNHGIVSLSSTAAYGDFLGTTMSTPVSSWIIPRLRRGVLGNMNASGVACAIPVRSKNQYRLFFNNGTILTMTLRNEGGPGFTWSKYYLDGSEGTYDSKALLIPVASTSQVDWQGIERIYVSHYNENSPITTAEVFALESGNSFNGTYIPHEFTINWYFGDTPSVWRTLAGVRAYGLSRGLASLNIQATGPQSDFYFKGNVLSTTQVPLNLPRTNPIGIVTDVHPVTNRADISARGLALQVRIYGSNTDLELIEPTHVVQVLTLYTSPDGAFDL